MSFYKICVVLAFQMTTAIGINEYTHMTPSVTKFVSKRLMILGRFCSMYCLQSSFSIDAPWVVYGLVGTTVFGGLCIILHFAMPYL